MTPHLLHNNRSQREGEVNFSGRESAVLCAVIPLDVNPAAPEPAREDSPGVVLFDQPRRRPRWRDRGDEL